MKRILSFAAVYLLLLAAVHAQSAIRTERSGSGDPILFLPGFGSPGSVWDEIIAGFPGHESIRVTYAGFDGLEPVSFPWYSQVSADLIDFVRESRLSGLTVVGHSMGGNLAVDLAAALPDHIVQLVLVDALPCMREVMMPGVSAEALAYESPYNDQVLNMDESKFADYVAQMTQGMASDTGDQNQLKKWMLNADRRTFVYGYTDLLKLDLREKLPKVKSPVLILVADQPFGQQAVVTMEGQYQSLENKTIRLAPDSRHFIMLDQPTWLVEQLRSTFVQ